MDGSPAFVIYLPCSLPSPNRADKEGFARESCTSSLSFFPFAAERQCSWLQPLFKGKRVCIIEHLPGPWKSLGASLAVGGCSRPLGPNESAIYLGGGAFPSELIGVFCGFFAHDTEQNWDVVDRLFPRRQFISTPLPRPCEEVGRQDAGGHRKVNPGPACTVLGGARATTLFPQLRFCTCESESGRGLG